MENLTSLEICVVVIGALLALAAAINTVGSAFEKISKAVKAAKAPDANQNVRLDKLEKEMVDVKAYLAIDKTHLEKLDDGNRVTQRALLALLEHGIDGNHVEKMKSAKTELQEYLISR